MYTVQLRSDGPGVHGMTSADSDTMVGSASGACLGTDPWKLGGSELPMSLAGLLRPRCLPTAGLGAVYHIRC